MRLPAASFVLAPATTKPFATSISSPRATPSALGPPPPPVRGTMAPQPMHAQDASVFGVAVLLWVIGAWFYQRLWRAQPPHA